MIVCVHHDATGTTIIIFPSTSDSHSIAGKGLSSINTCTGVLLLSVLPIIVNDVHSSDSPLAGETIDIFAVPVGVVDAESVLPTLSDSLVVIVSVVRSETVSG